MAPITLPAAGSATFPRQISDAIFEDVARESVVQRLNQDVVRVLNLAAVKEKFLATGAEPVGSSSEQLAATIKSELVRLGKVIKDAAIRAD